MTSVKRPKPSDHGRYRNPDARGANRVRVTSNGVHAFDTQARSLEQACEIIAHYQAHAKKAETRKARPLSLRHQFVLAKSHARLKKDYGKISLAPVGGVANSRVATRISERYRRGPHPLRDLSDDDKQAKAQDMYMTGTWGVGLPAHRKLARAFGVPLGAMVMWLDGLRAPL